MIDYTLINKGNTTELNIPTNTQWGTICFAWDPNDTDNYGIFVQKLEEKGIEAFAQLLADNPNTAFTLFCTQS